METADFFEPINPDCFPVKESRHPLILSRFVKAYRQGEAFPSLDEVDIAILGVKEDRNAPSNEGCALAPDYVRKYLYQLFQGPFKTRIADLGNIAAGDSVNDTYFAVKTVIAQLLEKNITPVIIGGGQDITYANYTAYESLGQIINVAAVDARFDIGLKKEEPLHHQNYLNTILTRKPNYMFNFANIGYQGYFVDQDAIELMDKLYFDIYRLGWVRNNMEEVEPIVRNADLMSFDVSAIRQSDAPGNTNASPNGFYGEEACQIVRYAGLSDKLSSIGFYELNPAFDMGNQTAHLVAQMVWYFIDGYYHRKNDYPDKQIKDSSAFIKYVVTIREFQNKIQFYKSKRSDRWWMEVPCPPSLQRKYERQFLVPCSYHDYQEACRNEIPDKWWQVYQKFV
ncbi:MAG: formimidoylglutamase [Bacteroidales bacterium]